MENLESRIGFMQSLSQTFRISSFNIDPSGKATLSSIAAFLQEMAYRHATLLGFGFHDMVKRNMAWILSRFKIEMKEYPSWDEEIEIETWPCGVDKLFALRDFKVYQKESGNIIGKASTCWLMTDIKTHRPLRPQEDLFHIELRTDRAFDQGFQKIDIPENLTYITNKIINFSDLDVVRHTNNVKYIEWCSDALGAELITGKNIKSIYINFLGESLIGDEVELFVSDIQRENIYFSAVKKDTGKECFRAVCKWLPNL